MVHSDDLWEWKLPQTYSSPFDFDTKHNVDLGLPIYLIVKLDYHALTVSTLRQECKKREDKTTTDIDYSGVKIKSMSGAVLPFVCQTSERKNKTNFLMIK